MTDDDPINQLSAAMMQLRIMIEPMHEFLIGEIAYFEKLGFTAEQARTMAFSEYSRFIMQAP